MEEIVIVAGGLGIRLDDVHQKIPKTLLKLADYTILDRIVGTMSNCLGNNFRLFIAVGIYYDVLKEYVETRSGPFSKVEVIKSEEWREGNAATLLAVEGILENEEFLLQMSDHLFSPDTYTRCTSNPSVSAPYVCGQPKTDGIQDYLDLDDATKVLVNEENRIIEIGKSITNWNMIDMGLFRLNQAAFGVISSLPKNEKSLSGYVNTWNINSPFYVNPISGAIWKDIDTPKDLDWAKGLDSQGMWLP